MWKVFSGLANLVSEPIKQWQHRKTLKIEHQFELEKLDHEAKVAKANAVLEMARQGQQQDYDLDKISQQNMAKSWKDELVLLIFLTPVVMAFVPGWDKYVENGFKAIEKMPHWYVAIVIGMVVVIYGLRGLLKEYLQRSPANWLSKRSGTLETPDKPDPPNRPSTAGQKGIQRVS